MAVPCSMKTSLCRCSLWDWDWQRVWGDERKGWGVCRGAVPTLLGCQWREGAPAAVWGLLLMLRDVFFPAVQPCSPPSPISPGMLNPPGPWGSLELCWTRLSPGGGRGTSLEVNAGKNGPAALAQAAEDPPSPAG